MKLSQHIDLRELFPPETITMHGDKCADLIDPRLPVILERIRELCGDKSMILNTWHKGGTFKYRGYRPEHLAIGAKKSMHKQGMAADFDIAGLTADKVRNIIRENQNELMALGLTRIEVGISWVHIDLKPTGLNKLTEFAP